jgi:hypothetical protein
MVEDDVLFRVRQEVSNSDSARSSMGLRPMSIQYIVVDVEKWGSSIIRVARCIAQDSKWATRNSEGQEQRSSRYSAGS